MTGIGVCEGNDHTRNQLHQQSRVLSHISLSKSVFLYIFLFFIYDSLSSSSQSWHLWAQADPVHPNSTHASSRESYTSLEQFDGQEASEERVESSLDEEDAAKTIEGLLFNWGSKWSTHKTSKDPAAVEASSHLYDAIVVGGGAAGCPLARTLADSGKEVLLIERGRARKDRPETLDIYGAGIVVDNKEVSQPVITTDGVISHIASVLSGGSAINMAIVIQETDEYFDYLDSFPGVSFDRAKIKEAYEWTGSWLAHPIPENLPYGQRWRLGLDRVYGPHLPYRTLLSIGNNWSGSTSFNPDNNWFRVGSDVSLGLPGIDFPKTLHVLLNHNVHKIEFELDTITGKHRATCVQFARTTSDDIAPIGGKRKNLWGGTVLSLLGIFNRKKEPRFSAFIPSGEKYRACVKPGGEIVSSAGSLLTPLLLYRSGVGPIEFIKNLKVPLIREISKLGKNLRDRVLIPIGLFFKGPMPDTGFPPRICQSIGLSKVGSDCENFEIGERTLSCSLTTAEELSGARIAEGIIYATRFIVPPQIRNAPVVDAILQIARDCADARIPLNNPLLSGMCVLAQPLADCFRKVAANFYFSAEPKSIATIEITKKGDFIVAGNYLTDPQDLQDAMRGVANIIRVINSDVYDGVFEPAGLESCPFRILNGLINLADEAVMRTQNISATSDIRDSYYGIEKVKEFLQGAADEYLSETKKAEEWRKREEEMVNTTQSFYEEEQELEGAWFHLFGKSGAKPRRYWTSQRYATYPPSIPEPTDVDNLKRFAKTFMTSIWHWVGSASMGSVVDSRFMVKGFDNLRIVDGSVLPQVTRMNPFFTLTSIGRYAGMIINEDVLPPPP